MTKFTSDLLVTPSPLDHFWEHTIGSGHASLGLRADWQKQLTRCHEELGFKHVRFHGILSDDMGTLLNENNKLVYSFFNADQVCDFVVSIGMTPFMELSFMPLALSSGGETVFNYRSNITPPRSYDDWATLIYDIVKHWSERYGEDQLKKWFFEIWNEPNLSSFWTGTQNDYFNLYKHAVLAIKKIHAKFRVGGPASAANEWIPEFRNFCKDNSVPYDFISTHHYPTDAFGKPGDDTISQLAASKRSVLRGQVANTRKQSGETPVYYTEWSTSSNPFDELHDLPYAAAFIVKTNMEARGVIQGYSYWTFSDIFEENYFASLPFHGGFGLLTVHGIPKPSYRAYEILHNLGDMVHVVAGAHPTVDVWLVSRQKRIQVLITNSALPRHPIANETITVEIANADYISKAYCERIDDAHANARAAWVEMGSPLSLSKKQIELLEARSNLQHEEIQFDMTGKTLSFEIKIPVQGTALVTFEIND